MINDELPLRCEENNSLSPNAVAVVKLETAMVVAHVPLNLSTIFYFEKITMEQYK